MHTFFALTSLYYLSVVLFLRRGLKALEGSETPHNGTYSVVIAARNEEDTIGTCLDRVFSQTMSSERYEVIVVNDRSTDRTLDILKEYAQKYENLSIITIDTTPPGFSPKKFAVTRGIEQCTNSIVVFTDADCLVLPTWLETIDCHFGPDIGLVQGITTYRYVNGMNRLFYGIQALDFLSHGIVAAAGIGAKLPINSNANNFAIRKETFQAVGGYGEKAGKVISGDDDLLLQRVWHHGKWNIHYMISPLGAVQTMPTPTIKGAFEQRKRWGSKTVHYNKQQAALLSGVFLFYLSILLSVVLGIFHQPSRKHSSTLAGIKLFGELLLLIPGIRIFRQIHLWPYIIPASLIQLPMVLLAVILGVFGRFTWKGERFSRTVTAKQECSLHPLRLYGES